MNGLLNHRRLVDDLAALGFKCHGTSNLLDTPRVTQQRFP